MVVSYVKEVILITLEEMEKVVENEEEPLVFLEGEEVSNLLIGSSSSGGNRGSEGGD